MRVRAARGGDAGAITGILNNAIADGATIGKSMTRNVAERLAWITDRQMSGFPVLVAVSDYHSDESDAEDTVIGFAALGPWRDGSGYRHTVELSIYVHPDHQGEGIGKFLLEHLIEAAKSQDYHVLIAAIETSNDASIELHRSLNFVEAGCFREVGQKKGQWLDLTMMQLILEKH